MRALGATNVVWRGYLTRGRAVAPQEIMYVQKDAQNESTNGLLTVRQNKPKREVWFEPRRNHSAEGLRCILPVLTAEREGVCDVLNGLTKRPRARGAAAHWQNEPGHGGFTRSQNEPEHAT